MPYLASRIRCPANKEPELWVLEPRRVPRHVVGPDREHAPPGQPPRRVPVHPGPGEVALLVVPEAGVAEAHERDASRLDAHALALAARFEVGGGDDATRLQGLDAVLGGHVEENAGGHDRRYVLDAVPREAPRGLHLPDRDAATERECVGLVGEGVYVGAGVLAADKDPGRPRARARLVGAVLILVVAVQQVRVAGLLVGRVDGHRRRAWLLKVEDAGVGHAGARLPAATGQSMTADDRSISKTGIPSPLARVRMTTLASVSGLVASVNARREMPALCGRPD